MRPVLRVLEVESDNRMLCLVWCPGCDSQHPFWVQDPSKPAFDKDHIWQWNGSMDAPTFSPSLLVYPDSNANPPRPRCHSFLKDGIWEFLGDSGHGLAGQKIPMVPLPDRLT